MDIKKEKLLLIEQLKQVEDPSLIRALKAILSYGLKNEGHISLDQYNRELDEAEAQAERGETISHEEFKKQMKTW